MIFRLAVSFMEDEVQPPFNTWPVVSRVTKAPFGQVAPGGVVDLHVNAVEPDGEPLTDGWTDDRGGGVNDSSVKAPGKRPGVNYIANLLGL